MAPSNLTLDDPRVKGQRQNFDSKYLGNGDRCEVGPWRALVCKTHGLLIGSQI